MVAVPAHARVLITLSVSEWVPLFTLVVKDKQDSLFPRSSAGVILFVRPVLFEQFLGANYMGHLTGGCSVLNAFGSWTWCTTGPLELTNSINPS